MTAYEQPPEDAYRGGGSGPATPEATVCRSSPDSLLAALEARDVHHQGVGGAAAVSVGDRLAFSGAFGMADLEHGVPVSARRSRFQVASVTKAVTATTALLLHEADRLELDAPVTRYLPDFPPPPGGGPAPTARQLAGHLGASATTVPASATPPFSPGTSRARRRPSPSSPTIPRRPPWRGVSLQQLRLRPDRGRDRADRRKPDPTRAR